MGGFVILYGSQTGNAEALARRLYLIISSSFSDVSTCVLKCMDQYEVQNLLTEKARVIFVLSTFATGNFPDNAMNFWRGLHSNTWKSLDAPLRKLQYTVFGLGNAHTAENYNAAAKALDFRLKELSATRFFFCGQSNELDEDGHDTGFVPWCNGLKSKLAHASMVDNENNNNGSNNEIGSPIIGPPQVPAGASLPYTVHVVKNIKSTEYFPSHIKSRKLITPKDFQRSVFDCELSLEDSPLKYKLCDYVAVMPRNNKTAVAAFLDFMELDGDDKVVVAPQHGGVLPKIPQPIRIRELFECYLDLFAHPTKYLVSVLASYATNNEEKAALLSISGTEKSTEWERFHRERYTIVNLLTSYTSVKVGLSELVSYVPLIRPRLYSISSCPKESPQKISFLYSHRKWNTPSGRSLHGGLTTNFLTSLTPLKDKVSISIKSGTIKYSKKNVANPLIFVGLGTGIGSALAILQERKRLKNSGVALGPMVLYFSGRNEDQDFLFKDELVVLVNTGVLTHLITTFAYDTQPPQFIQTKMHQNPDLLWTSYLKDDKCMYIYCGLGAGIPDEIEDAIKQAIVHVGKFDLNGATEYIRKMRLEKRWVVENHTTVLPKPTTPIEMILESTELHEEISFSPTTGRVNGGTPKRLVEWVASKGDQLDRAALLLTFRKFLEPIEVFHIYRDLHLKYSDNADVKVMNNLLAFIRTWTSTYYRKDFKNNELKQEFWQFIESLSVPRDQLDITLGGTADRTRSQSTLTIQHTPSLIHKVQRLSKRHSVTDFDVDDVFEELDFIICEKFSKMEMLELIDTAWQKKDKDELAPNVVSTIKSCNFTSGWVATEILTAPSSKHQASTIGFMINLCECAFKRRNYELVMAILAGLNGYSVSRIHSIWAMVPTKLHDKMNHLSEMMSLHSNFKKYRDILKTAPAIPYLALSLRDITFANENMDYFENGLINFEKSRILYTIIKDLLGSLRTPTLPSHKNANLKDYITHIEALDESELYKYSSMIMPSKTERSGSINKADIQMQLAAALFNDCLANNITGVKNMLKENLLLDVVHYTHPKYGETALHICASEGRAKLVKLLVESGADVNARNKQGNTALHLAGANNHLKVAKLLVENKADLFLVNHEKLSALDVAAPRVKSYLEVEKLRPTMEKLNNRNSVEYNSTANLIIWDPSMSVGVESFDNDHRQLINCINLVLSEKHSKSAEALGNILDFLLHYTEFHFGNEEALFAKYNYPSSTAHKKEHIRLTEQVKQYNKLHKKGKVSPQDLSKFLQGWLVNHIMKEDMKYTDFFHNKGIF